MAFTGERRGRASASLTDFVILTVSGIGGFDAVTAGMPRDGALPVLPIPCMSRSTHVPGQWIPFTCKATALKRQPSPISRGHGLRRNGGFNTLTSGKAAWRPFQCRQPERNCIGSRLSAPRRTSKCMSGLSEPVAAETTPICCPALT